MIKHQVMTTNSIHLNPSLQEVIRSSEHLLK